MATSAITGKIGSVSIDGTGTYEFTTWSISPKQEVADSTSMESGGYREIIASLKAWDGSFTCLDFPNKLGGPYLGTFKMTTTNTATHPQFSGSLFITEEPATVPVDGRIEYAVTFQGTGSLTLATT